MSDRKSLLPVESMNLTVARARCLRGENPGLDMTRLLVLTLDRLLGVSDWSADYRAQP